MIVNDLISILEEIASPSLAEPDDSIGLQVGDPAAEVRSVAVALDPTPAAIRRAKEADILVAHHPIIHKPVASIACGTQEGDAIYSAVKNDLAVYVMHTNYDAARDGVNDALADALGLRETEVLSPHTKCRRYKIVVFVQEESAEAVRDAMAEAGGGIIGLYSHCSFRGQGIGSFRPNKGASPYAGNVGNLEEVSEWRLEMVVPEQSKDAVVRAMVSAHPYEEAAYDVYELAEAENGYGFGRIGRILPIAADDLLGMVKKNLRAPDARYYGPMNAVFEKIAVCGGAGGRLIRETVATRAQVYITGDVGYHDRLLAEHLGLAIVDAGHRETELPGMRKLAGRLRSRLRESAIEVRFLG